MFLPLGGLIVNHGQSRIEAEENRSEIKAFRVGLGPRPRPPASARKALKKGPAKPAPKPASKIGRRQALPPRRRKAGKWVFTFGDGKAEGKAGLRDLLGGKGANLAEMANLGLPVPSRLHDFRRRSARIFTRHEKILPEGIEGAARKGRWTMSAS